jgi:hypothetical protein
MTAATLSDTERISSDAGVPVYAPRVPPLERPLGALSSFATLLRNPLRILPTAVYDEAIVLGGRAGRTVCWITDPCSGTAC